MRWHLKTRARNRDYHFVGGSPERWWARFGSETSFERPTLLVERPAASAWRLLASAVPSIRHDRHHTVLRFTVAASGEPAEGTEAVERFVTAWLEESQAILAGTTGDYGPLSQCLDHAFPEETIEAWFADDPSAPELAEMAQGRLLEAISRLDPPSPAPAEPEPDEPDEVVSPPWQGSLHAPACRQAFLAQVRALVEGQTAGAAYLLNLAESPQQLGIDLSKSPSALLFDVPADRGDRPHPFGRQPTPTPTRRSVKKKERRSTAAREAPSRPSSSPDLSAVQPAPATESPSPDHPDRDLDRVGDQLDPAAHDGLGADPDEVVDPDVAARVAEQLREMPPEIQRVLLDIASLPRLDARQRAELLRQHADVLLHMPPHVRRMVEDLEKSLDFSYDKLLGTLRKRTFGLPSSLVESLKSAVHSMSSRTEDEDEEETETDEDSPEAPPSPQPDEPPSDEPDER